MPTYGFVVAFILSLSYLFVFYGNFNGFYNGFIDIAEMAIGLLYFVYGLVYLYVIRVYKDKTFFTRFLMPLFALFGSIYILYATALKYGFIYFIMYILVIFLIGFFIRKKMIA